MSEQATGQRPSQSPEAPSPETAPPAVALLQMMSGYWVAQAFYGTQGRVVGLFQVTPNQLWTARFRSSTVQNCPSAVAVSEPKSWRGSWVSLARLPPTHASTRLVLTGLLAEELGDCRA